MSAISKPEDRERLERIWRGAAYGATAKDLLWLTQQTVRLVEERDKLSRKSTESRVPSSEAKKSTESRVPSSEARKSPEYRVASSEARKSPESRVPSSKRPTPVLSKSRATRRR